jgi:hypothetical protein
MTMRYACLSPSTHATRWRGPTPDDRERRNHARNHAWGRIGAVARRKPLKSRGSSVVEQLIRNRRGRYSGNTAKSLQSADTTAESSVERFPRRSPVFPYFHHSCPDAFHDTFLDPRTSPDEFYRARKGISAVVDQHGIQRRGSLCRLLAVAAGGGQDRPAVRARLPTRRRIPVCWRGLSRSGLSRRLPAPSPCCPSAGRRVQPVPS